MMTIYIYDDSQCNLDWIPAIARNLRFVSSYFLMGSPLTEFGFRSDVMSYDDCLDSRLD